MGGREEVKRIIWEFELKNNKEAVQLFELINEVKGMKKEFERIEARDNKLIVVIKD